MIYTFANIYTFYNILFKLLRDFEIWPSRSVNFALFDRRGSKEDALKFILFYFVLKAFINEVEPPFSRQQTSAISSPVESFATAWTVLDAYRGLSVIKFICAVLSMLQELF